LMKELPAECRAPYTVQDSSIGADARGAPPVNHLLHICFAPE
jgi:hypothetical protein